MLSLLVYIIGITGKISFISGALVLIFSFLSVAHYAGFIDGRGEARSSNLKKLKMHLKLLSLSLIFCIFVPSKTDLILISGVSLTERALTSGTGSRISSKVFKLLERYIDEELKGAER